jgi:hypothetical protein
VVAPDLVQVTPLLIFTFAEAGGAMITLTAQNKATTRILNERMIKTST